MKAEPSQARLYEHRALELSIDLCEERHADACYALAYMYERGIAVERNPKQVAGLLAHVRMLCHLGSVPICARLPPAAAP